ncbi:peptidase s9 s15 protein [Diplodia corticola]|uniref:Peptidase s9 s15 protein n=1 Tax=Diplodia corticola TaxID=236234 RepID=A0A1J9RVE4_9PEZI|nr:peptidase s9 s15 protein [Diplodia corticola]OJD31469.1 peptidase s9 s15 protein [Diplodia corticola]
MVSGVQAAQFVGITASMFAAGQNATFSTAVVPSLLTPSDDEARLVAHWRTAYVQGFYLTPPPLLVSCVSFSYLSYSARSSGMLCSLYAAAAVLVPAIVPVHTFAIMRPYIGALCRRAERLAGPGPGTKAESLGKDEPATLRIEETHSTRELVRLWGLHNAYRTVTGFVGAALGLWAALNHARILAPCQS